MKRILSLMIMAGVTFFETFAAEKFELKTSEATLTIDVKGNLKIIHGKGEDIQVSSSIYNLWKVVMINNQTGEANEFTQGENVALEKEESIFRMIVTDFTSGNKKLPAKADFTISVKEDAFCFSGTLKSESEEWIFKELEYPVLQKISINDGKACVYWPRGLGEFIDNPVDFGTRSLRYPSGGGTRSLRDPKSGGAAMAWFSVNSSKEGLYIGVHDSLQETKLFNLVYDPADKTFKASVNVPVCNVHYTMADVMVKPYSGEWYQASKYYRSWYDKNFTAANPPEWAKNNSGWLLAILKQQNGEIMWPYRDIDKLCDIADQFKLGSIGLFGWTIGGHDHLYPDYNPCPLMGGRDELVNAIERAHKRGKKIILYVNGKIMDTGTDFYKYSGYETMVMQENGQPQIQYYIKQKNATPVIFAQGCNGSGIWRKTMFDLGMQAVSLGADGIIYDQVGIMEIHFCYAKNHDHLPGMSDTRNRLEMIREISRETKKINPGFIIMTEGTNDAIIRGIDYHHGCGFAVQPGPGMFPELFLYTFPELLTTQRNTNPMITREEANYAAVSGMRHEIESRYPPDVEYLLKGKLPEPEDYSNVVNPPDLEEVTRVPAKEAREYVRDLIAFEDRNPDFFRHGKFIAMDGIEVQGEDIKANGFLKENRIGVLVWNKNMKESRNYKLSVPGYRMVNACEPDRNFVNADSALEPNTVRLIVCNKNDQL